MRLAASGLAAAIWTCATAALAHDTFIVPPPTVTAGESVVVLVTSSSFFPEPEARIRPERIARLDARSGQTPLTWAATADDVAMTLTTAPVAESAPVVIVMSLAAYDIDVGADEISHYMDEIAAPADVRAAVVASVAANGTLAETYTKHLKTIVCAATCADNPEPGAATFEFVASPEGGRAFTLFLNGRPAPNQTAFLVSEAAGRTMLTTDASGNVILPEGLTGLVYLNSVKLEPPATPGGRFTSDWASLTFDARLLEE